MNSTDSRLAEQPFSHSALAEVLLQYPDVRGWRIALSGGVDSVALLDAFAAIQNQLTIPVSAIHVDHGLQTASSQWEEFCTEFCAARKIPLVTKKASIDPAPGESLEMAARRVRYAIFDMLLGDNEAIVTAHHQNDQAETLLLNLLNGSGVTGLAAIPPSRLFSNGFLIRPVLEFTRQQLQSYLDAKNIKWIEDPSNTETVFDRNFLRHEIIPRLEKRWPAAVKCINRSAQHQREQLELNQQLAAEDLAQVSEFSHAGISLELLKRYPQARQKLMLRHWLMSSKPVVNPSGKQLKAIFSELIDASQDAQPKIKICTTIIRRFAGCLTKSYDRSVEIVTNEISWQLNKPIRITALGISIDPEILLNQFAALTPKSELTVRFRKGGERFKPAGQPKHRKLKQLFQEWRVPIWQRDIIPLVFFQDQLIVVWGYSSVAKIEGS